MSFEAPTSNFADFEDFADAKEGEEAENEFPMECFPEVLAAMSREVSLAQRVPSALSAACVLSTLSAALGASLEIRTGPDNTLRGNLFTLISAPSGTGKGQCFKMVTAPLFAVEKDIIDKWKTDTKPSLDAAIQLLEAKQEAIKKQCRKSLVSDQEKQGDAQRQLAEILRELEKLRDQNVEPRFTVGDTTREKLAIILSQAPNESVACMSSEARGVVDVMGGRYSKKSDEDIYLAGFSGDVYKMDRVHRAGVHLRRPCLSVQWLVQPDKLEEMLANEALIHSGFLARFLLVESKAYPELLPEHPHKADAGVVQRWAALLRDVASARHSSHQAGCILPDANAIEVRRQFANEVIALCSPNGPLEDIDLFAKRWAEQAWRIMLVLHVGRWGGDSLNHTVDQLTAENAIKLVRWFARQQMRVLAPARQTRQFKRLDQVVDILSRKPDHSCTLRLMKCSHRFEATELKKLAAEHPHRLVIDHVRKEGAGRPSTIIRLPSTG